MTFPLNFLKVSLKFSCIFLEFAQNFFKFPRFYHFGYDKPDDYDEAGEPINNGETKTDSFFIHPGSCGDEDEDNEKNLQENESIEQTCELSVKIEPKNCEGNEMKSKSFELPNIIESNKKKKEMNVNLNAITKRSSTSLNLNIFDQTAANVLKMFNAKNWTDTFFNRIFRKKHSLQEPNLDNDDENGGKTSSVTQLPKLTAATLDHDIAKIDSYLNTRTLPAILNNSCQDFQVEMPKNGLFYPLIFFCRFFSNFFYLFCGWYWRVPYCSLFKIYL